LWESKGAITGCGADANSSRHRRGQRDRSSWWTGTGRAAWRLSIMSQFEGNIDDFGMDTISLAGPLEAKLRAVKRRRLHAGHAGRARPGRPPEQGLEAAVAAVKASGLRVTGFQVLRDFEGLSGHLHDYKVDIAKSMLEMCQALGCAAAAGLLVGLGRTPAATSTRWCATCASWRCWRFR
jgi:hypothetical protein